ncbi:MAG TPA: gamma-glutamyltransferase [Xanthobacteraceae bacterium]|nr:gamma-glutamyltransferase [Xanthobacteraceae bacterium]
MDHVTQNWRLEKPVAVSPGGIVVAQYRAAAEVGVAMLRAGGNAVDAAVAAAFALAAIEPWNSGLGGIGYMLVQRPGAAAQVIDFGAVSPAKLDPAAFPLTGKAGADLFAWPQVEDDRNIRGPLSIAVPGSVDGYGFALERLGSLPLAQVIEPAIALAEAGLPVDWYVSLKILAVAADLRRYAESRRVWLNGDLPPIHLTGAPIPRVKLAGLADTLRRIGRAGRRDFYEGEVAHALARDIGTAGGVLSTDDLARYRARMVEPTRFSYRDTAVSGGPQLTAGPTLQDVLASLARERFGARPDAAFFVALASALEAAYEKRLRSMGDVERLDASTTHVTAVDRDGMMVAMTTTLLSSFGSRFVSASTGILMNNGIMWFDPRPGRPNSLAPAKRPLCNMCPVILARGGEPWLAAGASGGRRILAAVTQLLSFLVDFKLDAAAAAHHPRIDVSGTGTVSADPRLSAEIRSALRTCGAVAEVEHVAYPINYACPNVILRRPDGEWEGVSDVMSPSSGAVGA